MRTTDKRGATFEQPLTINVIDLDEPPTALTLNNNRVDENLAPGATVGAFSTTDPDANDAFSYTLVSGTGSTDNAQFAFSGSTLQTVAAFDYETKNSYTIRVRTTDKGGLFTEQSYTISVNNVYEAPTGIANNGDGPSSDGSKTTFDVNENVATGTTIASLAPVNPDYGNSYTYELVSGDGSDDNTSFTVSNGGVLQTNAALDYETKHSYTVRVRITDSKGATFEQVLTILINDVPEAPTAVDDVVDPRSTVFLGGVAGTINVLANDVVNAISKTLSVASVTQPVAGTASIANSGANVSYLAPTSGNGNATFTYQATNGNGNSNSATVSLNYVANDTRGDCNGNGSLTAADFVATVLEIFDSGNSKDAANDPAWWLTYTGTYAGSPRGCDSNASGNPIGANGHPQASVTAADLICTVRLFFGYTCGAGAQAARLAQPAQLAVADAQTTAGASATLTVNLNTGGNAVAAATFALNLDPATLHFATTDADGDGVPDAIALNVPASMNKVVTWNATLHRLEVAVFGMSLPLPTLSDGALATVTVQVAATAPASTPLTLDLVTMSDPDGNDLPSTQTNGTLTIQGGATRTGVFLPLVVR
ncbi:MAG: cadherin domain-containing protein [Caldilineaceae bacterium]